MVNVNAKSIADSLKDLEYPVRIPSATVAAAKEAGLVIVYGASDDLMEFDGAIYDEVGVNNGGTVQVDIEGLIPDFESLDKDDQAALKTYFVRDGNGKTIEALWCAEPEYSWTYKTDIPHETFEVWEDGEHYCRGIVFQLADCK
jgi:hypothetical protein